MTLGWLLGETTIPEIRNYLALASQLRYRF